MTFLKITIFNIALLLSGCMFDPSFAHTVHRHTNDVIYDTEGIRIYIEMEKCKALDTKAQSMKCIRGLESKIVYMPDDHI